MATFRTLDQAAVMGKRVLLRAGFDVPIENGVVTETTRIEAVVPTMRHILAEGGRLIILAHQGRPKGKPDPAYTQRPLVEPLSRLLGVSVGFTDLASAKDAAAALPEGQALLVENLRYDPREEKNDEEFARELAACGDMYVNDAFSNAHRVHASMVALAKLLPAYMGYQLQREVEMLSRVTVNPARPLVLVASGVKLETKVPLIQSFMKRGDDILLGGAIANTFIASSGADVGTSLVEQEQYPLAKTLLSASGKDGNAVIHLPTDALVAPSPDDASQMVMLSSGSLHGLAMFDVGPESVTRYCAAIEKAATIVWNGPIGMYEKEPFSKASIRIANAIADATKRGAISLIGGGDTIDFHTQYGLSLDAYTFVSTGGGAMLDFISGEPMPSIDALRVS